MANQKCLVLGASGVIGSAVVREFGKCSFEVWESSRSKESLSARQVKLVGNADLDREKIPSLPKFDAVVWAQGMNANDSIVDFSEERFSNIMQANLGFVVSTLVSLLKHQKIESGAKLCVVSSIWQEAARDNKLSYMISKSALSGLIKSVAVDLAGRNIFVNAILPGVLDSPMTRSVLDAHQIAQVEGRTGFGRLISPAEVAKAVHFLCSAQNMCITGQSIVADLGFTNVRQI